MCSDHGEEMGLAHAHATSDQDPPGRYRKKEHGGQFRQFLGHRKPARVIWGHLIRCRADAGHECRTGSQALHAITMEGANAGEIASRCAADTDMANFTVQQAVNGRAIYGPSPTHTRSDGEID